MKDQEKGNILPADTSTGTGSSQAATVTATATTTTNHEFGSGLMAQTKVRTKLRTREKIEKMVSEGTKNYPAYLKLIYTGDSDFSSEDEAAAAADNRRTQAQLSNKDKIKRKQSPKVTPEKEDVGSEKFGIGENDGMENLSLEEHSQRDAALLAADADETFYDTAEINSPEYDNAVNQGQKKEPTPEELAERARQEEEWRTELAKLEEEITTLQSVLHAKVRQQTELKRKLGITAVVEFKQDMQQGIKNIKESNAYQKTNEQLSKLNQAIYESQAYQKTNEKVHQFSDTISSTDAYQKTSAAFKSFGAFTSRKMGDLRNSNAFKSFEDKMSGAYTNVKGRVSGSKSENNFQDHAAGDSSPEAGGAASSTSQSPTLPEEKVPL